MKESLQLAREALAKIAGVRMPTNDRRSGLWMRDVATKALASLDSALAREEPATPHEFLGRCQTCLDNAYLSAEPCRIGYGQGMPINEDECKIRRARRLRDEALRLTRRPRDQAMKPIPRGRGQNNPIETKNNP